MHRLVVALLLITFAGCARGTPAPSETPQTCVPAQDRPSCFYSESPTKTNTKLIIFAHGVFGSGATTWGNPKKETFWPEMVRTDPQFADYDIYLLNYHTPFRGKAPNIHETANNELGQLVSRKVFERYDEIYVIAHSMGGLVTKSILTQLNHGEDVAHLRRVKGVVYLSTPAQGAHIASVGAFLLGTDQLKNMEPASLNAYISSLEDQWIRLIEDRDSANAESPRAYCAYETLELSYVLVVPREMAASRCDGVLQAMPFNHSGMAEPTKRDADPYLWAMGKIQESVIAGKYNQTTKTLSSVIENFNKSASEAKKNKTIFPGTPIPTNLIEARNEFERAWREVPSLSRSLVNQQAASTALSHLVRLYRITEDGSETKSTSLFWSEEAISHFSDLQYRKYLTEALLDKAAIYLDLLQLNNNDRQLFDRVAREGDALMTRAYQTSTEEQRAEVLRITSRFYYALARPQSFRLAENWDNNYLMLAYEKMQEAYDTAPNDIKNANQLTRILIRTAKNPPQDQDKSWTPKLLDAQQRLTELYEANLANLLTNEQRLSPLDVIGTATLEYAARAWREATSPEKSKIAPMLLTNIETNGLSLLREATALLQNSEIRKAYGFDLYYDIARTQAIKTAILLKQNNKSASESEFKEVRKNLMIAKENAKTSQVEAAIKAIKGEITFGLLSEQQRAILIKDMSIGGN